MFFKRTFINIQRFKGLLLPTFSFISFEFILRAGINYFTKNDVIGTTITFLLPIIVFTWSNFVLSFTDKNVFNDFKKDWIEMPHYLHILLILVSIFLYWSSFLKEKSLDNKDKQNYEPARLT
ncbi:MAG: hypothetical protein A3D40_01095 [Parcubacteria group bacterium RIFCSPHIGHO2_02_FULL_40_12]|nr:MAG: hypothetical protein A3D40_01095 [Parcubacteria group bacterium RIFCSPHIGHO2_02_FULL_40_12]